MRGLPNIWAKYGKAGNGSFHPLMCHMVDVAFVAIGLWRKVLRPSLRQQLSDQLHLSPRLAGRWIAFWAGAHDIGKASPGFQAKVPEAKRTLAQMGFDFPVGSDVRHGQISAHVLREWLAGPDCSSPLAGSLAHRIAVAIGGHHGIFPQSRELDLGIQSLGSHRWTEARQQFLGQLAEMAGITGASAPSVEDEGANAMFMLLAGITTVADWIGSNKAYFPSAGEDYELNAYVRKSLRQAYRALDELGWVGWHPERSHAATFRELFPQIAHPRPLQLLASTQVANLSGPGLILIEAPMGEGKTEAALFLADHWTHATGQWGLYVALPTQATSNQMFDRVREFLARRYPADRVNLHLLHGHALLSDRYESLRMAAIGEDAGDGNVVAESWFAQNKKQALLAAFGVGTIDQSLLAVLQTKHVFVRLFALAGKTIVLDEVHAYDTYMSTVLERLLQWLAALGCSVVLLSATLPAQRRRRLLAAYAGRDVVAEPVSYPRMTILDRSSRMQTLPIPVLPERRWQAQLLWKSPEALADDLAESLSDGGCAAVISNTVGQAQQLYRDLRARLGPLGIEVELFHARFPFGQRQQIEERVLYRYGRPGDPRTQRPERAVLVATQVIEQSLDLDFDLMVSELAPVDLVLQRVGRLHRHVRPRPRRLSQPMVWLLKPACKANGLPDFESRGTVYSPHVLLRSYLVLRDRTVLEMPEDLESLVESVYGPLMPASVDDVWQRELDCTFDAMEQQQREDGRLARNIMLKPPTYDDDVLEDTSQQLEEDNPEVHPKLRAATRLTDPSVTLICLYDVDGRPCLDAAGTEPVNLERAPTLSQAKRLLLNAVTIAHPACVGHFSAQHAPAAWSESALLRFYRVALLDAGGIARFGSYMLHLDEELGITITKTANGEHVDELQPD